ncbi:beta-lactamase family protein [Planomonospora sp. ID67723]|uniref:serine hydrolase domain-containing protein n=1 Tax=Planomonospora sp. ID67723 TaxID=2738134 RepID=UPI0018C362C8|nr:serine hydrolase domain-containing protein [Planomonospora sp. ID67723]MBG0832393.1 beta-lactamase family protein [Planomonospora sp. ID67723]
MNSRRAGVVAGLTASMLAVTLVGTALAGTGERSGSAPAGSGDTTGLQAALDKIVKDGSVSAIAEVRTADGVWRGAGGTVTANGSRTPRAGGYFRIGSVTKTFTATVVLQLVGEERLELTDSVEKWLPGLLKDGDRVTLRQLLTHTSGLADYTSQMFQPSGLLKDRYRTWRPEEQVAIAEGLPRSFPPGEKFEYSNTNYIVLGMVVEKVTGRPYGEEVERRILSPLGLRDTRVPGSRPGIGGPHAHAYVPVEKNGKQVLVDTTRLDPTVAGAAGEMISTARDLNRFYRALLGGRLLGPDGLREMKETGKNDYGMGLHVTKLSCGAALGHSGGILGYATMAFTSPDGTRQIALSATPIAEGAGPAVDAMLETALCS